MLGDGSRYGINLEYLVQERPDGIAQSFILGENFIGNDNVALILGDNLFYGKNFKDLLIKTVSKSIGATIFATKVDDPNKFGVVTFNEDNIATSIIEKPKKPLSNYAVTGLYFYDNNVVEIAKTLTPSSRGELEITDINNIYLNNKELSVQKLESEFIWLDCGTYDSLLSSSQYVKSIQEQLDVKIGCLEEIAYDNDWISDNDLEFAITKHKNADYGKYLRNIYGNK